MTRVIRFTKKVPVKEPERPQSLMEHSFRGEVLSELYKKKLEGLKGFGLGFTVDRKGTIEDADSDIMAKNLMQATHGFGALGTNYSIGPVASQAWKETLWLLNDSIVNWGFEHEWTKFLAKELHAEAYLFYARSMKQPELDGGKLFIPAEWYMGMMGQRNPWMGVPVEQMAPPPPGPKSGGKDLNETK